MRLVASLIALIAVEPPRLSDAVMAGILRYGECAAVRSVELAAGGGTDEAVADAALRACRSEEESLLAQFTAEFGADAPVILADVRAGTRQTAIHTVSLRRGTAPDSDDPFSLWGACLGDGAAARRGGNLSAQVVADAALQECRGQEAAARANAIGRLGQANGEAAIRSFREQFRGLVARHQGGR